MTACDVISSPIEMDVKFTQDGMCSKQNFAGSSQTVNFVEDFLSKVSRYTVHVHVVHDPTYVAHIYPIMVAML